MAPTDKEEEKASNAQRTARSSDASILLAGACLQHGARSGDLLSRLVHAHGSPYVPCGIGAEVAHRTGRRHRRDAPRGAFIMAHFDHSPSSAGARADSAFSDAPCSKRCDRLESRSRVSLKSHQNSQTGVITARTLYHSRPKRRSSCPTVRFRADPVRSSLIVFSQSQRAFALRSKTIPAKVCLAGGGRHRFCPC